jgi:hypothetical protein
VNRRDFIERATATGLLAAAAGCSSPLGDGSDGSPTRPRTEGGDPASYAQWIPADAAQTLDAGGDGPPIVGFNTDLTALYEAQDDTATADETTGETTDGLSRDPMIAFPSVVVFVVGFQGFALAENGLGNFVEGERVAENYQSNGAVSIYRGSFDPDGVGESLTGAGGEAAGSYEGYDLYRTDGRAWAVTAETTMFSSEEDGLDDVRATIDAGSGASDRLVDTDDQFRRLVTALEDRGTGTVAYSSDGGVFDPESNDSPSPSYGDIDLSGSALGAATTATVGTEEVEAAMAVLYPSADAVDDRSRIESAIGFAADDRTIDVDGRLVTVSGTYRS